jgi:hypothetical protein
VDGTWNVPATLTVAWDIAPKAEERFETLLLVLAPDELVSSEPTVRG